MNREIFEQYDLLLESKLLHQDTLYDHRNVITDGKQFGAPSLDVRVDIRRLQ